jgi:hypothetical protein
MLAGRAMLARVRRWIEHIFRERPRDQISEEGHMAVEGIVAPDKAQPAGAVSGTPRNWLRLEGLAGLVAGVAFYTASGGDLVWLIPLILAVDLSMIGYLRGPRAGAILYNLVHNWAVGLLVAGSGWFIGSPALTLAGTVLVAHVGLDRFAGYGLKYPSAFSDTHLGRVGR